MYYYSRLIAKVHCQSQVNRATAPSKRLAKLSREIGGTLFAQRRQEDVLKVE